MFCEAQSINVTGYKPFYLKGQQAIAELNLVLWWNELFLCWPVLYFFIFNLLDRLFPLWNSFVSIPLIHTECLKKLCFSKDHQESKRYKCTEWYIVGNIDKCSKHCSLTEQYQCRRFYFWPFHVWSYRNHIFCLYVPHKMCFSFHNKS